MEIPVRFEWELLVVNNNCTDDTDKVCGEFQNRLPIRLLHEPTPGQSHARNLAIKESRGAYIIWTDDDVLVERNWMTALMSAFETHRADWVFGRSEPEWPDAAPSWYSARFKGYFAILDYGPAPFVVTDVTHPFYGLNFGGTKAAHLALNGFRTEFGFKGSVGGVGEDIDMFERAMKAGMIIAYAPDALVRHIIPPNRVEKPYHRRRQWVANPVYYRYLGEIFPRVPWLLGLPRFFYPTVLRDAFGYVRSTVTGNWSEQFHYELQVLRFVRLAGEAARNGFRRPARQP